MTENLARNMEDELKCNTKVHSENILVFLNERPLLIWKEIKEILDEIWEEIKKIITENNLNEKQYFVVFDTDTKEDNFWFDYGKLLGQINYLRYRKKKGITQDDPLNYIYKVMKENEYDYLIWISPKNFKSDIPSEDDKITLLWTLVHEFDHLSKGLFYCQKILDINQLLLGRRILKYKDSPIEYFATKKAKELLEDEKMFGKEKINNFIISNPAFCIDNFKRTEIDEVERKLVEIIVNNRDLLIECRKWNPSNLDEYVDIENIFNRRKICLN